MSLKSPGFIWVACIGGFIAQCFAYRWIVRWSNISPASSEFAFIFELFCAIVFYWIPVLGIVGAVAASRKIGRKESPMMACGALALNLAFVFGGGYWAISKALI